MISRRQSISLLGGAAVAGLSWRVRSRARGAAGRRPDERQRKRPNIQGVRRGICADSFSDSAGGRGRIFASTCAGLAETRNALVLTRRSWWG